MLTVMEGCSVPWLNERGISAFAMSLSCVEGGE